MTSFLLYLPSVSANTETPVISPVDGKSPYLVVTEDKVGSSKREPGIYTINTKGDWQLAMKGKPNTSGATKGILAQFTTTRTDSRYASLAAVDGELAFIEAQTSQKSVLHLNDLPTPMIDMNGNEVRLPKFSNLSELNYIVLPAGGTEEIVLISLQNKGGTSGDGVTIAFMTKAANSAKAKFSPYQHTPVVIDYRFRSNAELALLSLHEMDGSFAVTDIFSDIEIKRLVRKYQPMANPTLAEWVKTIQKAAKLDANSGLDFDAVPYLDLRTGAVLVKKKPMEQITEGENYIRQYFDVLNGLDSVIIASCEDDDSCDTNLQDDAKKIPGRLDLNAKQKHMVVGNGWTNNSDYLTSTMLVYIEKELYLNLYINTDDETIPANLIKIESSQTHLPESIGYAVLVDVEQDDSAMKNRAKITLIYSKNLGSKQQNGTYAVAIQVINQGYQILSQTKLTNEVYTSEELRSRISLKEFETEDRTHIDKILLDTLTPHQASVGAYNQSLDPFQPHYDVSLALTGLNSQYHFLNPTNTIDIRGDEIQYLEYKKFPNIVGSDPSGIYLKKANGGVENFMPGQLLTIGQEKVAAVASRKITFTNSKDAVATVFLSDQAKLNGASAISVYLALTPGSTGATENAVKPVLIYQQNVSIRFDQFSFAQVIQGTKKYKDYIFLVQGYKAAENSNAPNGYLMIRAIRLESTSIPGTNQVEVRVAENKQVFANHEDVPMEALTNRIRYSTDGLPYWIRTDALEDTSPDFEIMDMVKAGVYHPNKGDKVELASKNESKNAVTGYDPSESEYGGYGYGYGGSGYDRKWRYSGFGASTDQLPTLITTESKFNPSEAEKAAEALVFERLRKEFPELPAFFESLVTEPKPGLRVLLVSKDFKQEFMGYLKLYLDGKIKKSARMSTDNIKLAISLADTTVQDQKGIIDLYDDMKKQMNEGKSSIVFADAKTVLDIGRLSVNEEKKTDLKLTIVKDGGGTTKQINPHLAYFMGTEGAKVEPAQIASIQKRMQQIIIATPAEYENLKHEIKTELKLGALADIQVRSQELYSKNKFWPANETSAKTAPAAADANANAASKILTSSPEIVQIHERPMSSAEQSLFPDLKAKLNDLADVTKAPKHSVLIVPKDLKRLVRTMILSYWDAHPKTENFSALNSKLEFSEIVSKSQTEEQFSQADVLALMESLRLISNQGQKRALALGELDTMLRFAKPQIKTGQHEPFMISDDADGASANSFPVDPEIADTQGAGQLPHLLYLAEAEGRRLQPKDLLTAPQPVQPEVSMLLVGTEEEWDKLNSGLEIEKRFGLTQRFEKLDLTVPSLERRISLLEEVLNSAKIKSLGYRFDSRGIPLAPGATEGLSPEATKTALIGMLVNKGAVLSDSQSMESTSSFITILDEFTQLLTRDPHLRQAKVIDRTVIERLLSKVFNIPLNLNIIPKNDPLAILSDPNAALKLQEAGYEGPLALKYQIIRALLAQTKHDPTRAIPSSIMLFGGTGSGKTFLFETLCKMMGIKLYDFTNPNDEMAQAIIIKANNLTAVKDDSSGLMTVEEALGHVNNLLSLPNGYRAHIMFDDLHKANDAVRQKLIEYQQSLLEAKGSFRVKGMSGVTKDIPTRNLNLWTTLNPTEDAMKLNRFDTQKDDIGKIIATLNSDSFQVERSFFQRWTLILNLSTFPSEAKAPKLLESLRQAARSDFNVQNRLILVTPDAVSDVVGSFKTSNAREFLSAATSQLLQIPAHLGQNPFFIVVPKLTAKKVADAGAVFGEASGRESSQIEDFITRNTEAIPVDMRIDGQMSFMKYMADGFRTRVLEAFVNAIQSDPRFAGDQTQIRTLLVPTLHAMTAHFAYVPEMPINALSIDPPALGVRSQNQLNELQRAINVLRRRVVGNYMVRFGGEDFKQENLLSSMLNHEVQNVSQRSRLDVMDDVSANIKRSLGEYLQAELRMKTLGAFPDTQTWASQIATVDSPQFQKALGKSLADHLITTMNQIWSSDLYEQMRPEYKVPTTYDAVRLYLIALDREIGKLPWSRVTHFMAKSFSEGASSMSISQLPGFQHYLFTSKMSLAKAASHEAIFHLASNMEAYREWTAEDRTKHDLGFITDCNLIMRQR